MDYTFPSVMEVTGLYNHTKDINNSCLCLFCAILAFFLSFNMPVGNLRTAYIAILGNISAYIRVPISSPPGNTRDMEV